MSATRVPGSSSTAPPADEGVRERWSKQRVFVRALDGTCGEPVQEPFSQPRVHQRRDSKWKGGPQDCGKKIIDPQAVQLAQSVEIHLDVHALGGHGHGHPHPHGH